MATIAKEAKATNWVKIDPALLTQVFGIFYPDIDPTIIKLTNQQMAAMIERQAGKKTPEEIIASHVTRTTKRAEALPAEYTALQFPGDIQDILNRCGTRVVVSEKYPDTTEGRIKAVTDLKARLHRLGYTLEQAKAMPIKLKITRAASQRWDVVEFSLDDTNAVPQFVGPILNALSQIDPTMKFGKRKGAKAGVLVRLPEFAGKFNILINIPPEFAIEKPAKETPVA